MKRIVSALATVLVASLLVTAPAPAATAAPRWDSWSQPKANVQARLPVMYGFTKVAAAQVKRGKADRRARQVSSRWRPLDNATKPAGKWRTRKWQRIGPGKRKRLKIPVIRCFPHFREVQVVVRVKQKKGWSKPRVLTRTRGARTNDC